MKIKLADIVGEVENVKALLDLKFPIKVSYRLNRLVSKLQPELNLYDTKRNELVKEFGDAPQEDGTIKVTDPEKLAEFTKKLQELLDVECEIDFEKIKIDDIPNVEVSPKLLVNFIFE